MRQAESSRDTVRRREKTLVSETRWCSFSGTRQADRIEEEWREREGGREQKRERGKDEGREEGKEGEWTSPVFDTWQRP